MRKLIILLLSGLILPPFAGAQDASPQQMRVQSAGMDLLLEEMVQVEGMVWAMDFIDADTLIFTLLSGELGTVNLSTREVIWVDGVPEVKPVLGGGPQGETISGGLFDVLVDPEYVSTGVIYLAYVKPMPEGHALAVAQGELQGDLLVGPQDIFVAGPASDQPGRWGTRLIMDAERFLYVAVGDRRVPENAQDLGNHLGKIIRLNDDGSVPADNPFSARRTAAAEIWSYGHRNPQGLAFHPRTGELFAGEHGPDGGDEINLIGKGKNYGWPVITYGVSREGETIGEGTEKEGLEQPLHYFLPGIGPAGMSFYSGQALPGWNGSLFNGSLSRMHLNRLTMEDGKVVAEERLLVGWGERIRDVVQGPDGWLYLSTDTGRILRFVRIDAGTLIEAPPAP